MAKKSRGAGATSAGGVNNIIKSNSGSQTVQARGPSISGQAAAKLLSELPKGAKRGAARGSFRKVAGGFKKRRFTVQQRRQFRANRGPKSTQTNGPR